MEHTLKSEADIAKVCLLAGKIMLQSGGETYRVEDTMIRIAASFGIENSHSYVTPTGIFFSIDGTEPATQLIRIMERSTDLRKVALVNDISRKISSGAMTTAEAYQALKEIDRANLAYPLWLQIAAAALASGCFLIMFQGTRADFIPAMVTGGLGFWAYLLVQRWVVIKFFAEFAAALLLGSLSFLLVHTGFGRDLDKIIIGSVMPLVPGLLITNAVRDLMAGHLVSGLSKGAEAFLTAFAIGSGIGFVLSFYAAG
ncbi:threonine/serine exporter family protein [Paenibacillus doosanensis]|uniref:Inner membrane protein YjjP n=1 Tax=Paenibacillus konkukensis TaxID=2020716 RepID=A0ABY4RU30_9BACL|nr:MULTISPECIES: threonine/serine exporter family protein [Paenibacillus]MCS7462069.1 threonine/serine exporter family protein [Paenibacillus doosanensis]UQZ85136.1 Inner membrane protein YjjP [Paenibacillus konkukensis]